MLAISKEYEVIVDGMSDEVAKMATKNKLGT